MSKIKIGLIGCGSWGKNILRDLNSLGVLVDVVAPHKQDKENAINGGARRVLNNLNEFSKMSGFVVAANSAQHYAIINELLSLFENTPIFSEKPLCMNSEQAYDLYQKAPNHLFVMDKWRYHTGIQTLKRLVESKSLGNLRGLRFKRNGWNKTNKDSDCIWRLMPHDISIILELLGYVPAVRHAQYDQEGTSVTGMMAALGDEKHWTFLEVSDRYFKKIREIALYFDKGIALLADEKEGIIEIHRTAVPKESLKPKQEFLEYRVEMPLLEELRSFIEFIENKNSFLKSSAFDGYRIVKTIEDLRLSADKFLIK